MNVRKKYLDFFKAKGHDIVASSPLVPDDATLLFNNAGMVPFKSIFTGEIPTPNPPRATSCQTCLRAGGKHNDLENVGHTSRHHTFFEMLGNFSFGDYFKSQAIDYAWEFVTKELNFSKEKLYVTVHDSDDEAWDLWLKHVDESHLKRMGDADNFWQMGDTGPCGPCSEIFIDQGADNFSGEDDYFGGEGDRFLEIWNLVFMQYERDKSGKLTPLPKPSIDTGMGLERVVAVSEGKISNYDSSLFMPIIDEVAKLTNSTYEYESGASYRVIADHIRTSVFLLAQGINFSNEGRGYVLRRILRRAVRHGYLLGLRDAFMYKLVDVVVSLLSDVYPYLKEKSPAVKESIKLEEERFFKTISDGIALFTKELANTKDTFSGEVAFKLYDTYGFPLDLTEDMLKEKKISLDVKKFDELMAKQKASSKAAWKGSGDAQNDGDFKTLLERFGQNEFVGYSSKQTSSKVLALLDEDFKIIDEISSGKKAWILLDKTPFYAESGGQSGDCGVLKNFAKVLDTKKFHGLNLSKIELDKTLKVEDIVECFVDISRNEIEKHHSATHLLHATLFDILGDHISQAGSFNDASKLRFDFSHPKAMSKEELEKVEDIVNRSITQGIEQVTKIQSVDEAKNSGAKAQFGEKYGSDVRVVSFGDVSVELCGGTHVKNTSSIGTFIITKESGVSAGVRRIEAVCGEAAYKYFKEQRAVLNDAIASLKTTDVNHGITKLKEQVKTLKNELVESQNSLSVELKESMISDVKVIVDELKNGDIKAKIDDLKNQNEKLAVMLFQVKGEKVLIAAGSKNSNVKAGDWIKNIAPILGGGGGGRPDFAQAGGKDASKLPDALEKSMNYVKEVL